MQKLVPSYRLSLARRRTIEEKEVKKQFIFLTVVLAIIIALITAFIISKLNAREMRMNEYARNNNCTWHYTGSAYGDDRDLICK